jgi:hypothetical protein
MSQPELSAAARAFADGDDVSLLPSALSAAEGEALVALLVERGDAARLQRLGDGPDNKDKALAKLARKALHQLKTRGVKAPAPARREYRVVGPHAAEEPSLASSIDGRGERVVWLVRGGDEGFDVYEAQLSDSRGLIGFEAAHAPRKEWRQHAANLFKNARLGVGKVSERHARGLIEQGYQRALAAGRTAPEKFAQARLGLGHYEPEESHPALALAPPLPVEEARGRLAELHVLPELAMWIPPLELLPELDLAVGNIVTSKLVVEPAQRRAQLAEAVRRLADGALTAEYRALLGERLRETALLLAGRGLGEAARLATTAAALTEDAAVSAGDNPFVMAMFEKVVRAPESAEDEPPEGPEEPPRSPSGLILP